MLVEMSLNSAGVYEPAFMCAAQTGGHADEDHEYGNDDKSKAMTKGESTAAGSTE